MSISEKDLIKIRNSLQKVVDYIDNSLNSSLESNCEHENRYELTTMGKSKKEFMCDDCGSTWEEDYNVEELRRINIRVG